jgi:hypothetical protein
MKDGTPTILYTNETRGSVPKRRERRCRYVSLLSLGHVMHVTYK